MASTRPSRLIRLCRESRRAWSTKLGVKAGHKPGSVHAPQRLVCRGWVAIYLGPPLPTASSGAFKRNGANGQPSFLGLAPSRGLPSQHLSMLLVRSYRTFAPLPVPGESPRGHRRCVSVALSSRSPALGVTQQAWPSGSPDFPQPTLKEIDRNHLACFQPTSCLAGIIEADRGL